MAAATRRPSPFCPLLLWFLQAHMALALNLAVEHAQVYSGPQHSYFGFSLDFYRASDGRMNILVGAPKMNTSQPGVSEAGTVYLCPWQLNGTACTAIEFDQTGDQTVNQSFMIMEVYKSHQWMGASVKAWKNKVVACAPYQHWNVRDDGKESGRTPVGACYVATDDLKSFVEYSPCRDVKTEDFYANIYYNNDRRYCEVGFSADITGDGTLVVGAPGGYFFGGMIASVQLSKFAASFGSYTPLKWVSQVLSRDVGSIYNDAYKGYSLTYGEFTEDSVPEYVIGVPNYDETLGSVEIYSRNNLDRPLHRVKGEQVASYFGHAVAVADMNKDGKDDLLVGAPLFMKRRAGGKLTELGRVYLYLQRGTTRFINNPQILTGTEVFGQFGSSIAFLGDVDQDGYNDIAVGAPFGGRDGRGRVYIYSGKSEGINTQPSQVLESPFSPGSGFGFSMKGASDIDSNGYPDLIIGAYEAGKAVVYRAQPVVIAKAQLLFNPDVLNPDVKNCKLPESSTLVTCFTLQMCVSVSGLNIPEKIALNAELQLDRMKLRFARRTVFLDSLQPSKSLQLDVSRDVDAVCTNVSAYLRDESEFKDKLSPITVSLNFSLVPTSFSMDLPPILLGQTFIQKQSRILLDCGEDNVCIPDLRLFTDRIQNPLLIGDENLVQIMFNAINDGEGAYEAELHVQLPQYAHFSQVVRDTKGFKQMICIPKKENDTHVVVCDLGNPMKKGTVRTGLLISVNNLEEVESNVTFQLQIKSKNSQNPNSNVETLQIPVAADATLDLRGSSLPAELVLPLANWKFMEHSKKPRDHGEEVVHIYELHNAGPGDVQVDVEIEFPDRYQDDFFLYLLQLDRDSGITCSNTSRLNPLGLETAQSTTGSPNRSDHKREKREEKETGEETEKGPSLLKEPVTINCSSAQCTIITCSLERLEKGQRVSMKIHSILWVDSFMKRPLQQFILQSQVSYRVTGMPYSIKPRRLDSGTATTDTHVLWVNPDGEKDIPTWWIIVGVLAGLLLLTVFIFIMWKIGFFQRTRPPTDDEDELYDPQN
ncbi:integrin alpha-IIb isoform X1 [Pleurodeles waltl]|uniref:integrin alpha-IIb isoform X1 n=1 Tax=Pleurodeles waltl TaxID=8319 RepID=UPI003709689A